MCCASAVCWFSNHGGADKLGCLLHALPIAARSGSFIASTVNVCVYLGAAAAAMGCCLQGEIHLITFQFLMQCTSKCNHLHAKRMSLLHAATKRATCLLFEPDFVCSPDTFLTILQETRMFFSATFFRVATPYREMSWADFLLADIITSLAKPLSDCERALCHLLSGPVMLPSSTDQVDCSTSQINLFATVVINSKRDSWVCCRCVGVAHGSFQQA